MTGIGSTSVRPVVVAALVACLAAGTSSSVGGKPHAGPAPLASLKPGERDTNPYAQGLSIILKHLGHSDADTIEVMGRSGMAFALQMDLSGPKRNGVYDVAWWPNDCWAFDMRLPFVARAFGRELRKVAADPARFHGDLARQYAELFAPVVRSSIAAGRPLLAQRDAAWVVTGVATPTGPPQGFWASPGQPAFHPESADPPWGLIAMGEPTKRLTTREADLDSLRWAVKLADDSAVGSVPADRLGRSDLSQRPSDLLLTGKRAYDTWIRFLVTEGGPGADAWDANIIIHLRINRTAASAYLRRVAARQPGEGAAHIQAAAGLYDRVVQECSRAPFWSQYHDKPDLLAAKRLEYTAMVMRIARAEAQAADELRQALPPEKRAPAPTIAGPWMEQDSVAMALRAAAGLLGVDADYDTVAGLLANAFAPCVDQGEECTSWWHNEASMGTRGLAAAARMLGLRAQLLATGRTGPFERADLARKALAQGDVVFAEGGWEGPGFWNMAGVVASAGLDGVLSGSPAYGSQGTLLIYDPALWRISREGRPTRPRIDDRRVLREARARILGTGPYAPAGKRLYGLAAVDRMARQLREVPGYCGPCVSRGAKGWSDLADNAKCIMGTARSAAAYLVGRAPGLRAAARRALLEAAERYRRIASLAATLSDPAANALRPQDLTVQAQAADTILTPIRNEYQEIAALLATAIRRCR